MPLASLWDQKGGYPSDLTDAQGAIIEALDINQPWEPGRPMRLDLRMVINAMLPGLRTGCAWRYLPSESAYEQGSNHPNVNRV
jgi:transposase